jgi:hypothetical protein
MKKYDTIFWIGVILYLLENTYFGWHATAQSGAERVCDFITTGFLLYGLIGSIAKRAAREIIDEHL